MTEGEILNIAVEKARKNGWKEITLTDHPKLKGRIIFEAYFDIIFSHDFAKAFWEEECIHFYKDGKTPEQSYHPIWQYHLQQMVLESEPLKYLEKFL